MKKSVWLKEILIEEENLFERQFVFFNESAIFFLPNLLLDLFLFQSSAQSRSQFREVKYKSFYGCILIPYRNNLMFVHNILLERTNMHS
jgi:hypothetical protein